MEGSELTRNSEGGGGGVRRKIIDPKEDVCVCVCGGEGGPDPRPFGSVTQKAFGPFSMLTF